MTDTISKISTPPYEYLQEYQSIEDSFKGAPSSKYADIYQKIQDLETRISVDLNAIEQYETDNKSKQTVAKKLTSEYSELYDSIYAKLIIVGICVLIVSRYTIYYLWDMFYK